MPRSAPWCPTFYGHDAGNVEDARRGHEVQQETVEGGQAAAAAPAGGGALEGAGCAEGEGVREGQWGG